MVMVSICAGSLVVPLSRQAGKLYVLSLIPATLTWAGACFRLSLVCRCGFASWSVDCCRATYTRFQNAWSMALLGLLLYRIMGPFSYMLGLSDVSPSNMIITKAKVAIRHDTRLRSYVLSLVATSGYSRSTLPPHQQLPVYAQAQTEVSSQSGPHV